LLRRVQKTIKKNTVNNQVKVFWKGYFKWRLFLDEILIPFWLKYIYKLLVLVIP
jgi:hypothetical protein